MRSRTTRHFWTLFQRLPADVQERAQKAYAQFRDNPAHPGLQFKRVSDEDPLYSVRIGLRHRAVGMFTSDTITWFWIGTHDDYERVIGG